MSGKLTQLKIDRLNKPGRYGDGHNLWLQIARGGTKSWILRFKVDGRERQHGLGPIHTVTLKEARIRAQRIRLGLRDDIDPIEERRKRREERRIEVAKAMTFRVCAEKYIEAHRASWRNEKHAEQWPATFSAYVYPTIGDLSVSLIDTTLVLRCIEDLWSQKTETASRVRGRIEVVLDWATARGYRTGANPARWRGHLDKILPSRRKVRSIAHRPALAFADIPIFMQDLRAKEGISARALELTILTGLRTNEVIGSRWPEISLTDRVWTIPASRMKGGREHRVPLSERAVQVLRAMPREKGSEFVFPGARARGPISNMAMLEMLRRLRPGLTVHGFRSTFRDWAAERTSFPNHVLEMALAHRIDDAVEAAYRRGDLFEKRRKLMSAWADYCESEPVSAATVTPIRAVG